jgi:hypothetical protein
MNSEEQIAPMVGSKARMLSELLKQSGEGWAFEVRQGTIFLIGPTDFSGSPMIAYEEGDVYEAVRRGLLEKKTWQVANNTGKAGHLKPAGSLEVYVLRKPKRGETITLNEGNKVTVLYPADGAVHTRGGRNPVIPLSDVRPDEHDLTNWIYVGDMHQYKDVFCGQEIIYEATKSISGEDEQLLLTWIKTGQKDENLRKELDRRGIRVLKN